MKKESNEPILPLPTIRHDGWTGEAMAKFLETLAETCIVLDACDAAHNSSTAAYNLRRRHPPFAEAWKTALGIARHRPSESSDSKCTRCRQFHQLRSQQRLGVTANIVNIRRQNVPGGTIQLFRRSACFDQEEKS